MMDLFFLVLTRGGCASCLRACFDDTLASTMVDVHVWKSMAPTLLKPSGADAVGGQTRGDKIECSFAA